MFCYPHNVDLDDLNSNIFSVEAVRAAIAYLLYIGIKEVKMCGKIFAIISCFCVTKLEKYLILY